MTSQIPPFTQQPPTTYIQEFGAMNVLINDDQYNNCIKQQLQKVAQTQRSNFIILRDKNKAELFR